MNSSKSSKRKKSSKSTKKPKDGKTKKQKRTEKLLYSKKCLQMVNVFHCECENPKTFIFKTESICCNDCDTGKAHQFKSLCLMCGNEHPHKNFNRSIDSCMDRYKTQPYQTVSSKDKIIIFIDLQGTNFNQVSHLKNMMMPHFPEAFFLQFDASKKGFLNMLKTGTWRPPYRKVATFEGNNVIYDASHLETVVCVAVTTDPVIDSMKLQEIEFELGAPRIVNQQISPKKSDELENFYTNGKSDKLTECFYGVCLVNNSTIERGFNIGDFVFWNLDLNENQRSNSHDLTMFLINRIRNKSPRLVISEGISYIYEMHQSVMQENDVSESYQTHNISLTNNNNATNQDNSLLVYPVMDDDAINVLKNTDWLQKDDYKDKLRKFIQAFHPNDVDFSPLDSLHSVKSCVFKQVWIDHPVFNENFTYCSQAPSNYTVDDDPVIYLLIRAWLFYLLSEEKSQSVKNLMRQKPMGYYLNSLFSLELLYQMFNEYLHQSLNLCDLELGDIFDGIASIKEHLSLTRFDNYLKHVLKFKVYQLPSHMALKKILEVYYRFQHPMPFTQQEVNEINNSSFRTPQKITIFNLPELDRLRSYFSF